MTEWNSGDGLFIPVQVSDFHHFHYYSEGRRKTRVVRSIQSFTVLGVQGMSLQYMTCVHVVTSFFNSTK